MKLRIHYKRGNSKKDITCHIKINSNVENWIIRI